MEKDVKIIITDRQGKDHEISAPVDMSMNLMEVCKSYELDVEGTCGGMAMCASCQCYIVSNYDLPKKNQMKRQCSPRLFMLNQIVG